MGYCEQCRVRIGAGLPYFSGGHYKLIGGAPLSLHLSV